MTSTYTFNLEGSTTRIHYDKHFFLITFDVGDIESDVDGSDYIIQNDRHMDSFDECSKYTRRIIKQYLLGQFLPIAKEA